MRLASMVVLTLVALPLVLCSSAIAKGKSPLAPGEKVDINTASKADLMRVKGIGDVTSDRIIEGRPYRSVDDLVKVKGIAEKRLENMRPYLTVGGGKASKPAESAPEPAGLE